MPEWRKDPAFTPWESPVVSWEESSQKRRGALRRAWTNGNLAYKLDPDQRAVYDAFREWQGRAGRGKIFVLDISRRYGKTALELVIALEDTIRGAGMDRQAYFTDTERMAREIVRPLVDALVVDCPPELRPSWRSAASKYEFPGGQSLEVFGIDNPDRGRGRFGDRFYVDEAGFVNNLEYIVTSVILPQMQGRKGAYCLMGSTPPVSPSHYWSAAMIPTMRSQDACVHRTIYDSPRYSTEDIESQIEAMGGIQSTAVRRELLAQHVVESSMAIVPEYSERWQDILVDEMEEPEWFNAYTSLDPGWKDGTGVLCGYVDFVRQKLCIQGELLIFRTNTNDFAQKLRHLEQSLWPRASRWDAAREESMRQPHRRWTDIDSRLVSDLAQDHGLLFSPTAKDNKEQQIVRLRDWVDSGRIEISKSGCPMLHQQLMSGVYRNALRRDFARSGDGHFDLIDALIYLVRNVEPYMNRRPGPADQINHATQFQGGTYGRRNRTAETIAHKRKIYHNPGGF